MVDIRHVLCPVGTSDFSRRALDCAIAVARSYASRLDGAGRPPPRRADHRAVRWAGNITRGGFVRSADREQLREQLKALTLAEVMKNAPVPDEEARINHVLEDSFPASDAPSWTLGASHPHAKDG